MLHFFERGRTEWLRPGHRAAKLREQTGGIFVVTHAAVTMSPRRGWTINSGHGPLQSAGRASITIAQQALLQHTMSSDGQPSC
jgi:hypothetical protein